MPLSELLVFISSLKKLAERLPENYVGKAWFLENLEGLKYVVSVKQAAADYEKLGQTEAARMESSTGAAKLQLLLVAARHLQKFGKRMPDLDAAALADGTSPVAGLSMKDLQGDESRQRLLSFVTPPLLRDAVAAHAQAALDGIQKAQEVAEGVTQGAHRAGTPTSWKASLTDTSSLEDYLKTAPALLTVIDADKMEKAQKALDQASKGGTC